MLTVKQIEEIKAHIATTYHEMHKVGIDYPRAGGLVALYGPNGSAEVQMMGGGASTVVATMIMKDGRRPPRPYLDLATVLTELGYEVKE